VTWINWVNWGDARRTRQRWLASWTGLRLGHFHFHSVLRAQLRGIRFANPSGSNRSSDRFNGGRKPVSDTAPRPQGGELESEFVPSPLVPIYIGGPNWTGGYTSKPSGASSFFLMGDWKGLRAKSGLNWISFVTNGSSKLVSRSGWQFHPPGFKRTISTAPYCIRSRCLPWLFDSGNR
jgi:hypothetical protein